MPIHHAIWQVGQPARQLKSSKLSSEALLEQMIVQDPAILSPAWMLIGQQETTAHGGRIDLLAIAPDGSLVLVELKRDRTPREIVAQALDYASWVSELGADRITQIYARFKPGHSLEQDFQQRFGAALDEDSLNHAHQIIIVAAELAAGQRFLRAHRERRATGHGRAEARRPVQGHGRRPGAERVFRAREVATHRARREGFQSLASSATRTRSASPRRRSGGIRWSG